MLLTRLFFALIPDAVEQAALSDCTQVLRARIARARWLPPSRYHLTLHYLGESPESRADRISLAREVGEAWRSGPLSFVLDHWRWLGNPRRSALALCASRVEPQVQAHWQALRDALVRAGIGESLSATFLPHVTLAYAEPCELPEAPAPLRLSAQRYTLVQSVSGQDAYQHLQGWPLVD